MGVLYSVFPLDGEVLEWVEAIEVTHHDGDAGRYPSVAEVESGLSEIPNLVIEKNEGSGFMQFMATLGLNPEADPWTLMNLKINDGAVTNIGFEKGWPELIVQMLIPIAAKCGQLALIPDTGDDPVVIMKGDDLDAVSARWEFLHEGG